ncbi:hypothetical protein CFC21_013141 [Triticum aestivum]|uniref:Uncharacterized protein n=2 Tax=Triticum aestivum TaxID=4565 RepID=A0A9R1DRX4_WHEAT|nr:hypothetical protein CFC21_013141 [Triticum aestivum]
MVHCLAAHHHHFHGLLLRLPPFLATAHQGPHRSLQLRRLHEVVPFPVHLQRHGHAHVADQREGVEMLLRAQRPWQHRHAEPQTLQNGVPAAVGDEAPHGGVRQYLLLRRPLGPHEPSFLCLPQETLREKLRQVRVAGVLCAARDVHRQPTEHPQEAVAAALQAPRYLVRLRLGQESFAPEAEEQHGRRRLRVEPPQALVRLLLSLGVSGWRQRQHWADRVHARGAGSTCAPTFSDGCKDARLQLGCRVDDDAAGFHVAPAGVHEPLVGRTLPFQQGPREDGRRHRREAGQVESTFHLLELNNHLVVQSGRAQEERQHRSAGGKVHVRRHGELTGHV